MATDKKVYDSLDAAPVVLYAKSDPTSENAYPVLGSEEGSLLTSLIINIRQILASIANPPTTDKALNRLRVTNVIESGTVTTVTTVTTVSNQTNMDTYQGKMIAIGSSITAWALACRARIT